MSKEFWLGMLAGVIAGAVTGLMLAPSRGDETRHRISDAAEPAREKMAVLASRFRVKWEHGPSEHIPQAI